MRRTGVKCDESEWNSTNRSEIRRRHRREIRRRRRREMRRRFEAGTREKCHDGSKPALERKPTTEPQRKPSIVGLQTIWWWTWGFSILGLICIYIYISVRKAHASGLKVTFYVIKCVCSKKKALDRRHQNSKRLTLHTYTKWSSGTKRNNLKEGGWKSITEK